VPTFTGERRGRNPSYERSTNQEEGGIP